MRHRRITAFVFTVTAGIMIVGAAAYGCTVFKGKMTVEQSSGTVQAYAYGNNSGMGWCAGAGSKTNGTVNRSPSTFDVSVATSVSGTDGVTAGCAAGLPNGDYDVYYTAITGHCMGGLFGGGILINNTTFTTSSGSGGVTGATLPTLAGTGSKRICVSDDTGTYGMEVTTTFA